MNRALHLADEIQIAWCIQKIDLAARPFHRNEGSVNGETTADLFLIEVGDGVALLHTAHTGGRPAQEQHRLHQHGLA